MNRFVADIEGRTEDNHDFRRVLCTGLHMRLETACDSVCLRTSPPSGNTR